MIEPKAKKATVFVNASAGFDEKESAPELLGKMFEDAGIDADVQHVRAGCNLRDMSHDAVENGSQIVVAGGGDGTLSATAAGVVGTQAAFGVLPVGTLNHFARDLNIPLDLEQAAKVILQGHTQEVDVGEVNGKTFLNNSILGLYPIYRFLKAAEERRGWGKRLAFWRAVISVIWKFPSLRVNLHVNGQEIRRKTPYILIANNKHAMEGYRLGSRESLCDGKLWIYVMKHEGRLGLLRMLVSLLSGLFKADHAFEVYSAEGVWVETKGKRIGVALDGEVTTMESPLQYRIRPGALKVLVPPPPEEPIETIPLAAVVPTSPDAPLMAPQTV